MSTLFTSRKLSRREFLKAAGIAASAAAIGACTSQAPAETDIAPTATIEPVSPTPQPTPTDLPPTPTPIVVVEPDGFEMVLVEAGSFDMGSASGLSNEQPVHTVQLTRSFYVSKYEVTFDQYDEFCADAGSPMRDDHGFGRGSRPAIVNWYNAVEYCNWLSERAGLTSCYKLARAATECDFSASGYRLPTEAEWEYAARGGPKSQGFAHAGGDNIDDVAWYGENSGGQTQPVGQKKPNELGLHDMSGNLWDWCWDWYGRDYYASSPASDPTGPSRGSDYMGQQKVLRGGNYLGEPSELRVTRRGFDGPDYQVEGNAIRLVRTA